MTSPDGGRERARLDAAIDLFAVPGVDQAPLLAAHDAVCRAPHLRAWVAEQSARIAAGMGASRPGPAVDSVPDCAEEVRAYLPVLVFADVLPETLAHHRTLGVDDAVTRATLADVGRNLVTNRRWEGEPGLGAELTGWLTRHLHGAIFQLGRLQFERAGLDGTTAAELSKRGFACNEGDLALFVHIPARMGSLSPHDCDASFARAEDFFAEHHPGEDYRAYFCISWLLDPQLCDYLAPDSNILAFQRRFHLWQHPAPGFDADLSVRRFVFEDPRLADDRLPRSTSLERAVIDHVGAGHHWQLGRGWIPVG